MVSVSDFEFPAIKKICQQYMKFESVIERIIPHLEFKDPYNRHHDDWDVCPSFAFSDTHKVSP